MSSQIKFDRAFLTPTIVQRETAAAGIRGARLVRASAGKEIRDAIAAMGRNIRREEHYDFPLLAFPPKQSVYLWLEKQPCCGEFEVVGCACFEKDYYSNLPGVWCLCWIWMQPFARRQGRLTGAWPGFSKRHYPFTPQPPISAGLQQFLSKQYTEVGTNNAPLYGRRLSARARLKLLLDERRARDSTFQPTTY